MVQDHVTITRENEFKLPKKCERMKISGGVGY